MPPFSFNNHEIEGITEAEGRRMLQLLNEANPQVGDIRIAEDFVALINRCIDVLIHEGGPEAHAGPCALLATQWRDSIGRIPRDEA